MDSVLGIDGGGSNTVCVLMNWNGEVLHRSVAGPSNYQTIGMKATFHALKSAINGAVCSHHRPTIAAICLGLAGVDRPEDFQVIGKLVQQLRSDNLPLVWALQPDKIVICSDSAIALAGATSNNTGIVTIAGTGSMVFGRNQQGETKRAGGWGAMLGDDGSAYYLAIQGIRAALRSADGIIGETILKEKFREHLNLDKLQDIIPLLYRSNWGVKEIAALATIVDGAAAEGDTVSCGIIEAGVEELVLTTKVVIDALFKQDEEFELATVGGVWQGSELMRQSFAKSIVSLAAFAKIIWPQHDSAWGAARLALNTLRLK